MQNVSSVATFILLQVFGVNIKTEFDGRLVC